ncbi:MAG: helix-turn-helix domain-containing protein [Lachnospiraceae bacterium]|nr:helix-turn-helix domain-containing protein [Lachnospiraceae bacterium]
MKMRNELNNHLYIQKTNNADRLPYNVEQEQYANICSGDIEAVKRGFANIEQRISSRQLSDNPVRNILYHLVIAASAIAKACIDSGMGHDEAYTLADIYIRKADKCKTKEELLRLYKELQLDFTERIQEIRKQPVISLHIRKCIDYIYEHLQEELTVNALADYCGLNPSYLSRLFFKEIGIHMKQFFLNAKIDTAQNLLKYTAISYLDIAISLGFSSQSAFISAFKKITGTTPKKYRDKHYISNE